MKYFLFIVMLVIFNITVIAQKEKAILVILAHPDDETAFGSVLAKYARDGYKVQLVYAVDGRNDIRLSSLQSGDSVAMIKKSEADCACNKLGIEPPLFLNLNSLDRKHGAKDGVRDAVMSGVRLRDTLKSIIERFQPTALIAFGPDGEYGHPEHIVVHGIVTELLLREGWVEKYPLYYFGWPKSLEENNDGWVRYADDKYLNVKINYTRSDEEKLFEALKCYVTGFTKKDIDEIIQLETKREDLLYFRKFVVTKERQTEF